MVFGFQNSQNSIFHDKIYTKKLTQNYTKAKILHQNSHKHNAKICPKNSRNL